MKLLGRTQRQETSSKRWIVVAAAVVLLFVLLEISLAASAGDASLGVRLRRMGDALEVAWVQPAGLAWDAGVRPGDRVVAARGQLDGVPNLSQEQDEISTLEVRRAADSTVYVSLESAQLISKQRQFAFVILAITFIAIGGMVFVLASNRRAAITVFGFSASAAVALIAGIATPLGQVWALALIYGAFICFGLTAFLVFLIFPIDRLEFRHWRWLARAAVCVHVILLASYTYVLAFNPNGYEILRTITFSAVAADFIGASCLVVAALFSASPERTEVRRLLGLVALGAVAAFAPFSFLSIGPYILGAGYLIPPDISVLSIGLLPLSLGVAVLSRQFLGVDRLVRRGLVTLIVWFGLVALYTVVLVNLFGSLHAAWAGQGQGSPAAFMVITVALVAATFPIAQLELRRRLESALFHDVYGYAETLQQLGNEIVRLSGVGRISEHVLARLGQTLDLSWAGITLSSSLPPPRLYSWGNAPPRLKGREEDARASLSPGADSSVTPGHVVPLVAEGSEIGKLLIGPKRHDIELSPEDVALLSTLAPLVATSLRNALLLRRLEAQVEALGERERALTALSAQLMQVQEEERRRIALDLHDDPLQRAILLVRDLNSATDEPRTNRWSQAVGEVIDSLRAICTDLRPPALDDFGLVAGLEWLIGDVRARSDISSNLVVRPDGPSFGRLPTGLEVALYRVAQEALYNCLKHANATQVVVTIVRDEHHVRLSVADNGDGYGAAENRENGRRPHLGIIGMRERLKQWRGTLSVEGNSAGGTMVVAEVPLGEANVK